MKIKNNQFLCGFILGSLLVTSVSFADEASQTFQWPKGIKAAVNLSYDDALNSQLDNVIPALNKYKLKGTFYLQLSSSVIDQRLPEWRAAAAKGHELANHTLFHQCSKSQPGREWVLPERDLDTTTVAQMKDQVIIANTMLYAIDGKRERTFTAPCIDRNASGQNYINAIKSEFVAIKLESGGVAADMNKLDPYAVGVYFPSGVTGQQLIDVVKEAAAKGTMANFTFHGVGGDHLTVSLEAHEELLKYLAAHKEIWVGTFIDEMKYVKAHQKK
jgi:peptidoglycan/xylan/chitin deacetylase (PgdA/CDA1 family)